MNRAELLIQIRDYLAMRNDYIPPNLDTMNDSELIEYVWVYVRHAHQQGEHLAGVAGGLCAEKHELESKIERLREVCVTTIGDLLKMSGLKPYNVLGEDHWRRLAEMNNRLVKVLQKETEQA